MSKLKKLKPIGKPLRIIPRSGCLWCLEGLPDPAGICPACVAKFKQWLSSQKWTRLRRAWLSDPENIFCGRCLSEEKILVPAKDLHHVEPWRFRPDLFWDTENLEGLCHSCHSKQTVKEDGGFGRK